MPKQLNQIIGSFVFRNEGDGCLTSKYQNHSNTEAPFIEACKLIGPINQDDQFIGTYKTVWLEDGNNDITMLLEIKRSATNNALFDFTWYVSNINQPTFWGTGMLFEALLVGAYWD